MDECVVSQAHRAVFPEFLELNEESWQAITVVFAYCLIAYFKNWAADKAFLGLPKAGCKLYKMFRETLCNMLWFNGNTSLT